MLENPHLGPAWPLDSILWNSVTFIVDLGGTCAETTIVLYCQRFQTLSQSYCTTFTLDYRNRNSVSHFLQTLATVLIARYIRFSRLLSQKSMERKLLFVSALSPSHDVDMNGYSFVHPDCSKPQA